MPAFAFSGARSMISALRVGSPNSFRPRSTNAATSAGKLRQKISASGKAVKKTKVISTKGFLLVRSAIQATGR